MHITNFNELLEAARSQPTPQRLLFVFVGVELPEGSSDAERLGFEQGQGGVLVPQMCVDKSPDELIDFSALAQESVQFGADWRMVFVAAMGGVAGRPPSSADADAPLQAMVEAIKQGRHHAYIPFDRQGTAVQFA